MKVYFKNYIICFLSLLFMVITNAKSQTNPTPVKYRLLVAYTPAFAENVANIPNFVNDYVISYMNIAYLRSVFDNTTNTWDQNVTNYPEVQLAGIHCVNYIEGTGNMKDHLDNFISTDPLSHCRTNYAADVVCILTEQGAGNGYAAASPASYAGNAFFSARRDVIVNNFTAVHENGHLLGGKHENDQTIGDMHGYYYTPPGQATWATLMVVGEPQRFGRQLFYSNPNLNYLGHARGVTGSSYVTRHSSYNISNKLVGFLSPINVVELDGNDTIGNSEYGDAQAISTINIRDGFFVRQNGQFKAALTSYPGLYKKGRPADDYTQTSMSKTLKNNCLFTIPERGVLKLAYNLTEDAPVSLHLITLNGRCILNRIFGTQKTGAYNIRIFTDLSPGLLIAQFTAGKNYHYSQKIIVK